MAGLLQGKRVVVTGASRGIGAAIAKTLARDGATVVCADLPSAGDALAKVANQINGTTLQLDISAADAPATIAARPKPCAISSPVRAAASALT